MGEMKPFDLLAVAVAEARDCAVPLEATPGGRDVAESLLRWARGVLLAGQALADRAVVLSVGATDLPLDSSSALNLLDSDLSSDTFDYVLLEIGERRIVDARSRLRNLLRLLVRRPVNSFTARYLERIGLLYLWGHDVEVHVMSRAVLDAALQELIPGEAAKTLVPRRRKYANQVTLHDRLCLARCSTPNILERTQWERAWKLKEDGNDVLHTDVAHALHYPDALVCIGQLQIALESLPSVEDIIVLNPPPKGFDWNERPAAQ